MPPWQTILLPGRVTILVMPPRIGPRKPVRVYLGLWRERVGLTQEQVGQRIDPPVDKGTVSRWENAGPGRLTLGVIAAYAEALDLSPADLYRHPPPLDQPPSLDDLASGLTSDLRNQVIGVIEALRGRRAG